MLNPFVTIIIVNFNSHDVLKRCLEAIRKQTYQEFTVLIIDNGSEQEISENIISDFEKISLIKNQANIGFAAANNQAIFQKINTKWIAFVNPDAFPEPDWLENLVNAAEKNPEYSMFASRLFMDIDPEIIDGEGDSYHMSGMVWRTKHGENRNNIPVLIREVFSPCAAAALIRHDVLVAINGFDEDYFCYVEDVDLGFRLRLIGHRCLLVPDAIVRHVGSATTGGQHSDFSLYHGHRNLVWTFVKNMPGYLFWMLLPLHLLLNITTIVYFTLNGRGKVILKSKWDAIRFLPAIWCKRQEIQSRRLVKCKEIWRILDKRLIPLSLRKLKFLSG